MRMQAALREPTASCTTLPYALLRNRPCTELEQPFAGHIEPLSSWLGTFPSCPLADAHTAATMAKKQERERLGEVQ